MTTNSDKKIGISVKTSVIFTIAGVIVIFFPRHFLHPFIHDIGSAIYFIGVFGLFLNLTIKKLAIRKSIISIPLALILTILIMVLTVSVYQRITATIKHEIESDGAVTDGIIKSVNETTVRGRRRYFVEIAYSVDGQSFSPSFDISNNEVQYYQVDDTLLIQYSRKNPRDYQIIENKRLKENILRLLKTMDKDS